jgi:hypothetical protein
MSEDIITVLAHNFLLLIGHVSGPLWASCDVLSYPFPTSIAEFHKRKEPTSPILLRGIQPVLPTGRNFCRKTQEWPQKNLSGRENPRPNFLRIGQKMAEKGPNFFEVWFSYKILDTLKKKTIKSTELLSFPCYNALRIFVNVNLTSL